MAGLLNKKIVRKQNDNQEGQRFLDRLKEHSRSFMIDEELLGIIADIEMYDKMVRGK
jgi:hypothetical protein